MDTNLITIVRATRASTSALARMQRYGAKLGRLGTTGNLPELRRAYARAERDYRRAQQVLAANPLPGERSLSHASSAPSGWFGKSWPSCSGNRSATHGWLT